MNDFLTFFLVLLIAVVNFATGLGIGRSNAPDDCDAFGKFKHNGTVYECHKIGGAGDGR